MKPTTYQVVMKSGRKFMVEEFTSHATWLHGTHGTTSLSRGVLVKEVATTSGDNPSLTKGNGFKNICFIQQTFVALDYINQLDQLGLERIENKRIKYYD